MVSHHGALSPGEIGDLLREAASSLTGNPSGLVPADLPFNVPSSDRYPYARYLGLLEFVTRIPAKWDFIVDLGGRRDETPTSAFWTQAFATEVMLRAYFKLLSPQRLLFTQLVSWIRDPVPGRPGGVQTVPPNWPSNLPTPVNHVMTRYAGFDSWVNGLSAAWAEACRLHVFGVHEPFDPVWWLDYHKTVDVYIMYSKLSPELRVSFMQSVSWLPDGPGQVHTPDNLISMRALPPAAPWPEARGSGDESLDEETLAKSSKMCYLVFFRPEHHPDVGRELGKNPWGPAVAAKLLAGPGLWASGKFVLSLVDLVKGDGTAYVQAHVERSASGVPISQLLQYLGGPLRVGATADFNALVNTQGQDKVATPPTIFPTRTVGAGVGVVMNYSVYAILNTTDPSMTWIPMADPVFSWLLGAFESVRLEVATFDMQISTGAANSVWACVAGPTTALSTLDSWLATPINAVVNGSDQGYVNADFVLPPRHPFEPELRSPDPAGNPTPTFRFAASLVVGARVIIKGSIRVHMAGQYALGHVNIGPKAKKTSTQMRALIVSSLPYDTNGTTSLDLDGVEEDDSSDDEEGVPTSLKAIGSAANSSAVRR